MMNKPYPAFCRDCKHSRAKINQYQPDRKEFGLRCIHPKVNADNSWALADENPQVTRECQYERSDDSWRAACGKKGKLWEPRE